MSSGQGELVIRPATARDLPARAALVRSSITEYDFDAFLAFFFQELTLQVCVLCGAVLFIFCGAGVCACAAVVPAVAVVLALGVWLSHRAMADAQVQRIPKEIFGFVAEYRGPLVSDPRSLRAPLAVRAEEEVGAGAGARVVGTVSVSPSWGARRGGRLQALGVARAWRARGAGGALLAACRARALLARLDALDAVTSELQPAARRLLHSAGWQLLGTYQRPLLGAALTLGMAQLGMELPRL